MNHEDLYNSICKVLTWYEHPEEYPFDEKGDISNLMYEILVRVQNELFYD